MRKITIPADVMQQVIDCDHGRRTCLPVKLNWPELQLTEDQMLTNALAVAAKEPEPYPDLSRIELVFER